jgi:hypothetical protein
MVQSRTVKKLAANSNLQLLQNHWPPAGLNERSGHMLILPSNTCVHGEWTMV